MMARAWLLLADILVYLLLLMALVLFYLYPPVYTQVKPIVPTEKKYCPKKAVLKGTLPLPTLDFNVTMTAEALRGIAERCTTKEYHIKENIFLKHTLEERLKALSVTVGDPVFIRIFKEESLLEVWIRKEEEYRHLKDYSICAYSGHLGPKLKEGDRQSPEGFYKVTKHQLNPRSKFHLSFNLGYPNVYDRAHHRTGSFLMVHGNCVSVGCYAMTDEKIEEIYALVKAALYHGQPYINVHAFPFKMTEKNMDLYVGNRWYDFWTNLKEGYDYFEVEKLPPMIGVQNRHYIIYEANE